MGETCRLRAANGVPLTQCDLEACVFWRHATGNGEGCAIQYFDMIGGDAEMAAWLLALKTRLEEQSAQRGLRGPDLSEGFSAYR